MFRNGIAMLLHPQLTDNKVTRVHSFTDRVIVTPIDGNPIEFLLPSMCAGKNSCMNDATFCQIFIYGIKYNQQSLGDTLARQQFHMPSD